MCSSRWRYANLPRRDDEEAHDSPWPRQEPDPHNDQLEGQSAKCNRDVKPVRKMLNVPADPRGQRAILVILVHGREVAPLRVAAGEFDHARLEIDAKPLPQQEKNSSAHGRLAQTQSRPKAY